MSYNEDEFMEKLDEWDDRDKRDRFLNKMKHKLRAKEQYYGRRSFRH